MIEWFYSNEVLIEGLLLVSITLMLATLVAIPFILARIPQDYFLTPHRHRLLVTGRRPVLQAVFLVLKNLLGAIFIVAGILMLILPGQGVLTIIAGLVIMEYPRKFAFERWLVSRPGVLPVINWIRQKAGQPELHTMPAHEPADNIPR